MSLWKIAWRSVQQRWLASSLTSFSMALGVMLVVAVVTIHGVVSSQFRNSAALGYNLIVGPKGGSLQLTLNSVYYLSRPIENLDYRFYLEFLGREARDAQIRNSFAYQAHQAAWQSMALATLNSGPIAAPWSLLLCDAAEQLDRNLLDMGRNGRYADYVELIVPLCMGDYYDKFRVVGTTPDMFDVLPKYVRPVEFSAGRNFRHWSPEHGFFEAVVGSVVARERGLRVGDKINPSHGGAEGHSHENEFTVVGILRPTGTPQDRAVFVNMEGFLLLADHIKPLPEVNPEVQALLGSLSIPSTGDKHEADHDNVHDQKHGSDHDHDAQPDHNAHDHHEGEDHHEHRTVEEIALPLEQREVTAALIRTANFFVAPRLKNIINEGKDAQIVEPVREIYDLLDMIVSPVQRLLLGLTLMIIIVSSVSILVSIYNSMSERRHEIAVMRALGASRWTVMAVILGESVILSVGGGGLGWLAGHTLNWLLAPVIEERTGVRLGFWDVAPPVNLYEFLGWEAQSHVVIYPELLLVPVLLALAVLAGLLPAMLAYRTDVAESLGK